ncbi:MAG: HAMP domain-containing sensor histidine kinase [Byssovorax sp.]
MKLRARLSLAVTGVTAAALLASFAAVLFLVRVDETRDLDHALAVQAHATALMALGKDPAHPVVVDGEADVPESLDATARYIAVYDAESGALVSATHTFGDEAPSFGSLGLSPPVPWEGIAVNLAVHDAALRGVVIPLGNRRQMMLFAASRRTVDDDTHFLWRVLSALFFGALVSTALVARFLGGRLAADVDAIARVARDVAQGDLAARVGRVARGSAETRALANDLDYMIERLGALVAAQRTFISYAAHELRSPLATIRGELQLALRRPREAAEYRRTLEGLLGEVNALVLLAEDLLTLARAEADASAVQATPIGEAVTEAIRMARGQADARKVTLREIVAGAAAEGTQVRGARGEIARVVRNLVDNAVAHSPEGATVIVEASRVGERVAVAVTDEGPGVASGDAPHIFAPFFRGSKDQSGDQSGAGLGLAIAREIARRHGGDVLLEPSHAGGARFVLELPVTGAG